MPVALVFIQTMGIFLSCSAFLGMKQRINGRKGSPSSSNELVSKSQESAIGNQSIIQSAMGFMLLEKLLFVRHPAVLRNMIWLVSSLLSISRPTSKCTKKERKFVENSKVCHLILLVAGKEVLWNGKSGKGMAKLQRARRGVWGFEEKKLTDLLSSDWLLNS